MTWDMLTHMSSNDAGIKIVAAARRVPNNDTNCFAVVEFMCGSACGLFQKSQSDQYRD
jgi:hypothetical protein